MNKNIRALIVAPYEGMKTLMSSLSDEYPEIDMNIYVGDLEKGVEIAKNNYHADYDVIISRGGTAKMLQHHVPLPVIEIENSIDDILCALKLAGTLSGRTAIVSFPNVADNARALCELLNYNIDIITIDSSDEAEPALRLLQKKNYDAILCDMIAKTTAIELGINAFLITSGIESLRHALDRAVFLCQSQARLRYENQFLREVISGQTGETMIFRTDKQLFFSSIKDPSQELLEMFYKEIAESRAVSERRIIRNVLGMLYSIRVQRISGQEQEYIAFFFSFCKTPLTSSQCGISFFSCLEVEDTLYNSLFILSGSVNELHDTILKFNQGNLPVMVSGENGVGKENLVNLLYTRSNMRDNPYVLINCALLNDKSWSFLMEHHNSPLTGINNTIYFNGIDILSEERRRQMLAVLLDTSVCKRNRVLFSCVTKPEEQMTSAGMEFASAFCCLTIYLPPLRQHPERIPPLVSLYLSHLNQNMTKTILGLEPEAMRLLQEFRWSRNFNQLKRVINELVVTAVGRTITVMEVKNILLKEKNIAVFPNTVENAAAPLELNRTLADIEKDIVRRVLAEMDGNQSAAAKSLGISRTTLWRLLRE